MKILELKNTVTKQTSLDGLNRRMEMTEEKVNELEDKEIRIIQPEKKTGKRKSQPSRIYKTI